MCAGWVLLNGSIALEHSHPNFGQMGMYVAHDLAITFCGWLYPKSQ